MQGYAAETGWLKAQDRSSKSSQFLKSVPKLLGQEYDQKVLMGYLQKTPFKKPGLYTASPKWD